MSNKIKALMTGSSLTVILTDGTFLVNNNADIVLFNKVKSCENEEDILALMAPELSEQQKTEKEERIFTEHIVENFKVLEDTGDFEVRDNCVYLTGINRSLPKELIKKFLNVIQQDEFNKDEYQALKNFWYWLVLNPNSEAVEGTFEFIDRKSFKIMKNGFLLAYRWVKSKGSENQPLVEFVSNNYIKIKTKHKKNPGNYTVWKNSDTGGFSLTKEDTLPDSEDTWIEEGNLKELYLELPSLQEDVFTDGWTSTFKITIGSEVIMDRKATDESRQRDCSKGLHFCRDLSDYAAHGNVALLVAVNPMNIVSVPESHSSKARCCAYMPLAVLSDEEDYNILDDADTLELLEEYNVSEIEKLEEMAKSSELQDLKKNYIISDIKNDSFQAIVHNLTTLKEQIQSRIVNI